MLTSLVEHEGASVAAGQLVARVSELDNYRVEATLSDFHARLLTPGQAVRVEQNGEVLPGTVHTILPEIQNGTIKLLVDLAQPGSPLLRNKMRVDVAHRHRAPGRHARHRQRPRIQRPRPAAGVRRCATAWPARRTLDLGAATASWSKSWPARGPASASSCPTPALSRTSTASGSHPNPPKTETTMIRLSKVSKTYRTDKIETLALKDIDLMSKQGEFVALMGPSGCGKSTLLNLIGLLDRPGPGSVSVDGAALTSYRDKEVAKLRNRTFGFIFQSFHLIPDLRVIDNVELPLLYRSVPGAERRRLAREALERWASARAWTTIRTSCRAASSSAWRSRARSSASRRCCSRTSRPATSTARCQWSS